MSAPVLTLDDLAAALAGIGEFEARPAIAVAVSGGPDSMALALLADGWAKERGGYLWALTVDHGLRPESAIEARTVAGWMAARGISHAILRWEGKKPATGIQEAARAARYRLLAAWCRENGILHLLTAHHREDQAETHLIRRRAGSGPDGLAGMPAVRELLGCRLVRPFLGVPRARLAAFLAAERQPFLYDPSNLNPAFERARLRLLPNRVIPRPPEGRGPEPMNTDVGRAGATIEVSPEQSVCMGSGFAALRRPGTTFLEEIIASARAYAPERIAREAALDRLIGGAVALHPAGFAAIDAAALANAEPGLAERLLGRVAACIGTAHYPARSERLARLRAGLMTAPERARTLGGCRFVPWRGRVLALREIAAAGPPAIVEPGGQIRWDDRFAVALAPGAGEGFEIGFLGPHGLAGVLSKRERGRLPLPPIVHQALPAFRDRDGIAAVPHLGYRRAGIPALPAIAFRPANPLTRGTFTVV